MARFQVCVRFILLCLFASLTTGLVAQGNLASARVFVAAPTTPRINAAAHATTGKAGLVATTQDQGAGMTYAWTITGGSITGGQGTRTLTYTAGALGALTLRVTVTNSGGTASNTATVMVVEAPVAHLFAQDKVLYGDTFILASASPQAGMTFLWTLTNGTATATANGSTTAQTLSYRVGATPGTYQLALNVQNAAGDFVTQTRTLQVVANAFLKDVMDPTARAFHTATPLPDGRILVVGGLNDSTSYCPMAELYDPATNTWASAGSLLGLHRQHTATLLGNGKVLVAGGGSSSAELYDPATNTWSNAGSLAAARTNHTATLLRNGMVLVAGGYGSAGTLNAELYDPGTNTWFSGGSQSTVRSAHTATLLGNGKVLVAGGYGTTGALASAELYDPATNTWSSAGRQAAIRRLHTATLLANGKVLVAGGYGNVYLSSAELYDPATNTWASAGRLAGGRAKHTATLLGNGKVLVAGGGTGRNGTYDSAELYDPTTNTWSSAASMAGSREYHTATPLGNGKVLVVGGQVTDRNSTVWFMHAKAELYDAGTNTWSSAGGMTAARFGHTTTQLMDGKLLVVGGQDPTHRTLSSAELYDPATKIWSSAGSTAVPHMKHTAILLQDGKVLVLGGDDGATDAELYDPVTNSWASAGHWVYACDPTGGGTKGQAVIRLMNGKVLRMGGWYAYDVQCQNPFWGWWMDPAPYYAGLNRYANSWHVDLYDPATNTWTDMAQMLTGRYDHTATLLQNGMVLVTGGESYRVYRVDEYYWIYESYPVLSAELYNPTTNTWSGAGNTAVGGDGRAAVLLQNGKVLVTGGSGGNQAAELYDPGTNTWSSAGSMAYGRAYHTMTVLSSGKVLVAGGLGGYGRTAPLKAEFYDPGTNTWSSAGSLTGKRSDHTATLLGNGEVLLMGGVPTRTLEFYKP